MAGRPKKIVEIQTSKMSKNERDLRKRKEKELKVGRDDLIPPEFLSKEAAEEFVRIATEAGKCGILDNLDRGILATYADSYAGFARMTRTINSKGTIITVDGKKRPNPAVMIQQMYKKQMLDASAKLGIASVDRLKLAVPVKEEKKEINPFFEFLKKDG